MTAKKVTDAAKILGDESQRHLILWDGDCGFCQKSVEWGMKRDRKGLFASMPYQSVPTPPMTPELAAACQTAVHVLTADGQTLRAGRAALFLAERIGFGFLARIAALPPFIYLVEWGYQFVASRRYFFSKLLFGKEAPVCRIPERK